MAHAAGPGGQRVRHLRDRRVGFRPHETLRTTRVPAVAVALLALTAAPSTAAEGPFKRPRGPAGPALPAVNGTFLIWTESSRPSRTGTTPTRVRATGERFRSDPGGMRGYTGGSTPTRDRAIYQRIDGLRSDLYP